MENQETNLESLSPGMRLHIAETAIHLGRQALIEARSVEPIDEALVADLTHQVHQARHTRKTIIGEIRRNNLQPNLGRYNWTVRG